MCKADILTAVRFVAVLLAVSMPLFGCAGPGSQEAAIDQDIAAGHYNGPDALSLGRSLRVEPPGYSPWPTN
jgi:hypothetical protein